MKLDIILVDLAVVALVVVPYMLFIVMGWGESRKLKNTFLQQTAKHLGKKDEVLSWNEIMTGLDRSLQKLVFVQRIKEGFRVEVIDLKAVKACELKTEYFSVNMSKQASSILKQIDLEFTNISGEKFCLNLFNHDTTYRQDYELKNAEKMHASLSKCLCFRPVVNSAA